MEQQQQGNQIISGQKMKIKPQEMNLPFSTKKVLSFQICENNNFHLFDQEPGEKPMDLRHCLVAIFLQDDPQNWVLAEVGDLGDGPQIFFDYQAIPQNSKEIGIINNKQFMPVNNNITVGEVANHVNKNLAGKYYLLVRDNCYTLAHLIGQQYCAQYNNEAMSWCNDTILRTTTETGKYIGNKIAKGTNELVDKGISFGKGLFNDLNNKMKKN